MEIVAIKMLIGMISGIGCSLISIFFEKVLLEKRSRVFKTSKKEESIITILSIVVGCFTVVNVNRIWEIIATSVHSYICYRFTSQNNT